MKTMKHSGKKILSVFLAALMVMTAWVFVAPEQAEAVSATTISSTNTNALATVTGGSTEITYVYGSFVSDTGTYSDAQKATVYNKVLYSPQSDGTNYSAAWTNFTMNRDYNYSYYHYPETVLAYDSDNATNPASFGVALEKHCEDRNRYTTLWCGYFEDGGGLSFANSNWWYTSTEETGSGSYRSPKFYDIYLNSNINKSAGSATSTVDSNSWYTGSSGWTHYLANKIQFTDTMDNSTYIKTITPTLGWVMSQNSSHTQYRNTAKATRNVYVINVIPWKAAIASGLEVYDEIAANPAKYTTESVAEYCELATNLLKTNPNNYINTSGNNATGWASAAKTAVDNYNAWSGLEVQKYSVTFKDINGNVKFSQNYNYGTALDCASIAPANTGATQIAGDASYHRLYKWNTDEYVSTLVDDIVINEISSGTESHKYGTTAYVDASNHKSVCSDCGYEKVQAHTPDTGRVTKEPTCEETGVRTYNCTGCSTDYKTESIVAQGHSFTSKIYAEKEEGQNGTHYQKCIRCDKYGWGVTEGNCEAHKWQEDSRVNAECETDGLVTYKCTVCGSTSYTMTLARTGHESATYHKGQAKSCGVKGWSEYWTCDKCGDVFTNSALTNEVDKTDADANGVPDAVEIAADSHIFNGQAVSVTPGKEGAHNYMCSNCGKAYGVNGVVDATEAHDWKDPEIDDSTCIKEGLKTYKCKVCGQTYTETIAKKDHAMTKIEAVEEECGKAGNNEYYSCSTCGKYYKDEAGTTETTVSDETIPALVHKWTAHHDYDTLNTPATCQSKAVYNNHCDYCKIQLIGATHEYGSVDTVNGHKFTGDIKQNADGTHSYKCTVAGCTEYGNETICNYEVTEDVASTCKTPGYTTYTCTVCKNGYSTTKALDPNNHTGEGTYIIASSEPTCATLGSTGIEKCSGCNETLSSKINDIPVDLTKHENMQDYEKVDSTCQTEGYKAYRYCSACGTYEIEKETIPVKAHKYTTYTPNGDGTHTATCDTCDAAVATPATDTGDCAGGTANCVDVAVCVVCSGKYGDVDSANHKTVITVKKKDSTCQTEGHDAYKKCEACGVDIDTITPIAKKDHVYGSWSANNDGTHSRSCTTCDAAVAEVAKETVGCSGGEATCIAKAKCSVCKAEYGEINSANHATQAATLKNAKEASCTEEGYTGDRHYNCCDVIKEKGTAIPKLDHKYTVALEDTKVASTCTEKGSIDYQCETCDATEKRELELNPQNHSSEETIVVNDKAPTCESDGYTGDTYHKCCYKAGGTTAENRYALISKGSVIKANGQHVYSAAVPEYMIDEIVVVKDAEGNVTSRSIKLKTEEPDYAEKITYRRADNYWYHKQICTICYEVVETRCYTYPDHQADCVNTDICFVCEGLCSLTNPDKHTLKEIEKISATCEKDGRKAYYVCEDCDKEFFDLAGKNEITDENKSQLVIPSTKKHTIDRDETPKADNKGNHTYSCSVCGTAIVEACSGGEATCQDKAKCEYCGVGYGELNKNKHVKGTIIQGKVDPDRCKPGVSGKTVYECCPDVVVYEGDITPATEPHDWKETTDKADNCANGYTITKTCNYCGEVEITEVAAGTHDLSVVVYETEKDCKKERTIYYACSICGFTDKEVEIDGVTYKYIFAEVIEAKEDCTWTSWTYEQKPNCVVEGKKTRKCVACGKTEEEILPKTDHTIKTEAGYAATCDNAGKQDYVYCVIEGCPYAKGGAPIGQLAGYEKYKDCNGKVIEALGHGDHNGDDYCDHCGGFLQENEDGTNCNCVCHKRHWFMRIIYKILRFFWKLFGISRTCCSAGVHY